VVKAFVQKKTAADKRGFMQARQEYPVWDMLERFAAMLKDEDVELDREEASELLTWLKVYQNRFDRPQLR
jgi:hypothetical protein